MALVVVSNSASSAKILARFRDVRVPVLSMEAYIFDDMRMTGTMADTDFGDDTSTQIVITNAGHALAAGLANMVTVTTAAHSFTWGLPAPAAVRVATLPAMANKVAIFAYDAGAMMVGQAAPAKRVGLFAGESVAGALNADGEKLLDAAIDWAAR
jgi:hypothetical protein